MPPRLLWKLLLIYVSAVVLVACQPTCVDSTPAFPSGKEGSKVDTSLIAFQTCALPCWQNVVPGKSTKDDLMVALQKSDFVDTGSIRLVQSGSISRIFWRSSISKWPSDIGSAELDSLGQVSSITINWIEYSLKIGQVVDTIGQPEWVNVYFAGGPEMPETCTVFEFAWPQQGLIVTLQNTNEQALRQNNFHISPNWSVTKVAYLSSLSMETYVKDRQNAPRFVPWSDFQTYTVR